MIINLYNSTITKHPNLRVKEMCKLLSQKTGVGQKTIQLTISNYKNSKTIKSPNRTKIRQTFKEKMDDFERNAIRRMVHDFWLRQEIPTLTKILHAVNNNPTMNTYKKSTLHLLLGYLNFEYTKRGCNSAFIEREDIVLCRSKYIQDIKKYRTEGRHIYYLGDTWINIDDFLEKNSTDEILKSHTDAFLSDISTASVLNSTSKGERLIVVHIGSEEGFVGSNLLVFESKKRSANYRDEINGEKFFDWIKGVIPVLKDNSVIVMENTPYNSEKIEQCPTLCWSRASIESWLDQKGEQYDNSTNKVLLMEIVNRIKPLFNKYVIDDYVKTKNITVLRLPPNHCELNLIELAWSFVKQFFKINNSTSKLTDVNNLLIDGVNQCGPEIWKKFVDQIIKEEERFWDVDLLVDYLMENFDSRVKMTTDNTLNSDTELIADGDTDDEYIDCTLYLKER